MYSSSFSVILLKPRDFLELFFILSSSDEEFEMDRFESNSFPGILDLTDESVALSITILTSRFRWAFNDARDLF
jgi:hypothetical protein